MDDATATLSPPSPPTGRTRNDLRSINGKHVLVTGGTSGISAGRRPTRSCGASSHHHLNERSPPPRNTADELTSRPVPRSSRRASTPSSLDAVRTFAATYADRHDRLDVLINNAGTMAGKRRTTPDGSSGRSPSTTSDLFLLTNLLIPPSSSAAPA
ncbi:MAG: SDR family NAD(P)-dependent oxidoreductase [Ilumatobacteraceae bacterium]